MGKRKRTPVWERERIRETGQIRRNCVRIPVTAWIPLICWTVRRRLKGNTRIIRNFFWNPWKRKNTNTMKTQNFRIGADGKVVLATVGYDAEEFDEMIKTIEKILE